MPDDTLDPETLAAFLDGTLPPERRAAVLRLITRSPEAYELFAETAGAAAEMHRHPLGDEDPDFAAEDDRAGGASPPRPEPAAPHSQAAATLAAPARSRSRLRRLARWAPLAAAAAVTAVAIVAQFGQPPAAPVLGLISAAQVVRAQGAGSVDNALGVAWDNRDWSVLRGSSVALPDNARAFRIGVGLVDFELTMSVRDSDAAREVARDLATLLADVDAGAPIASRYARWQQSIRALEPPPPDARAHAASSVRELLAGSPWLDLGIWAEQARLAVMAGRTAFFARSGRPARELASVERRLQAEGARAAGTAITKVEQALPPAAASDVRLEPIRAALDALFRASGG